MPTQDRPAWDRARQDRAGSDRGDGERDRDQHRARAGAHDRLQRWLSKIALAQSGYGHFFIEHNRGQHVRVATPEDPASARMGESFWAFLPRTVKGSQLPTGYAGMIVLALVPPLWRRVMDRRLLAHYGGDVLRANIDPRVRRRVLGRYGLAG